MDDYISQYGKRLFGLCLTLCNNYSDAEDLYQDTWLKVIKNIDKYSSSKPFEPWLTTICVNTYRNSLKRLIRSPIFNQFSSSDEKEYVMNSVASKPKSDYSELHDAIRLLPDKLRVTVILFYFQELDVKSTAQVLHIPEGTVKSRLNKARSILKESMKDEADLQF